MKTLRCVSWLAAGLAAMAPALIPSDANACGGLFCDSGPQQMPVDQSGENIIFVWKDGSIEVHIQIQYVGDAAKFGWVIPLQSLPEFSVGSEPLFQALLNSTVPTYGYTTTRDQCDTNQDNNSTAAGGFDDGGDETGGGDDDDSGGEDPGPQIIEVVQAGAFEITVIQGDDAQEVMDWLAENEYLEDPDAVPILQQYIDEGHIFGAVKLTGGAGVEAIHPIVLEFQGDEPCVPLRLTRIAAVENMGVRSFFLGEERMVPRNYRHVLVNPLKIDWLAFGANYNDVITLAVDEENADGRAFVTEYAGPSSNVDVFGLVNPNWDSTDFETVDPTTIGDLLYAQGLFNCDVDFGTGCAFAHPLLESLLAQYIVPPAGVGLGEYLSQQINYPGHDLSTWNGPEFAMKMDEFIIRPAVHAVELIEQNPYLTRMFTTISPAEMTEDPMFYENGMLPDITNIQQGVLRILCNGDQLFTLPDGRQIYLPEPVWPELPDEPEGTPGRMVSAEIIEAVPPSGAPMNLTNNTAQIDAVLAAWNQDAGWNGSSSSDDGCGCTLDGRGSAWLGLLALAGLGLAARRRRP